MNGEDTSSTRLLNSPPRKPWSGIVRRGSNPVLSKIPAKEALVPGWWSPFCRQVHWVSHSAAGAALIFAFTTLAVLAVALDAGFIELPVSLNHFAGTPLDESFSVRPSTTLTVLTDRRTFDYPFSIFLSGSAARFGSGRFKYSIEKFNSTNRDIGANEFASAIQPPCLVASSRKRAAQAWRDDFAPHCFFMLTSDEFCNGKQASGVAARQYDSSEHERAPSARASVYLPLGPRMDFTAAFREVKQTAGFASKKSSERELVYNAMFSKSTSSSRKTLARILRHHSRVQKFQHQSLVKIADDWSAQLSEHHADPTDYTRTLLDSTFTLAPAGHHPECYRMFEAMEAGSIPIVAVDTEYSQHKCKDSLRLFMDADSPIVFLDRWEGLPAKLDELLADRAALDRRQERMKIWYEQFMRSRVAKFEAIFETAD